MRKYRRKKSNLLLLILLVLGVSVGYAILSAGLNIMGTAGINENTWDIHWENVVPNSGSTVTTDTPIISEHATKVSFSVNLALPGDFYEFDVDAKNDGSIAGTITEILPSMQKVVEPGEDDTLPDYIKFSVVYKGTNQEPQLGDILEAGEKQTYTIRIEYDSEATELPDEDFTIKVEEDITYSQYDMRDKNTVTFNPNGGTVSPRRVDIDQGSKLGDLPTPVKGDIEFTGWYTEINGGLKVNASTEPDGNVTYYAHWHDLAATFDTGENVNAKFKRLAGNSGALYSDEDTYITAVRRSTTEPTEENKTADHIVSSSSSVSPIYAWFDNGTIYYWSEVGHEYLNKNADYMFSNLVNATGIDVDFNASETTSMNYMFSSCGVTSLDLNSWDTSKVTKMDYMFKNSGLTSLSINKISTVSLTSMTEMFRGNYSLTELDVSNFDVSKVSTFSNLFNGCSGLKTLDLSNWKLTNAYTFESMFQGCVQLEELNLTGVKAKGFRYMDAMFAGCMKLKELDLSGFDIYNANSMNGLFNGCSSLKKLNISGWYFYRLSSLSGFFAQGLTQLEEIVLDKVNTSTITNMSAMFAGCVSLKKLDLSSFDTSKVTNMGGMFSGCSSLTTISVSDQFVVDKVTTDGGMFYGCDALVGGNDTPYTSEHIGKEYAHYDYGVTNPGYFNARYVDPVTVTFNPNGGSVTHTAISVERGTAIGDLPVPFKYGYAFKGWYTVDLNSVKVDKNYIVNSDMELVASYTEIEAIFDTGSTVNAKMKSLAGNSGATRTTYDTNVKAIVRSPLAPADIESMTEANIVSRADSGVPIYAWFEDGTIYWWTEAPVAYLSQDASYFFYGYKGIEFIDTSFDTSLAVTMQFMFSTMDTIQELDVSNFNTSSVTTMEYMFSSNEDITKLDLSNFDTSNVTEMSSMFSYANSLEEVNLSNWDFRKYDKSDLFQSKLSLSAVYLKRLKLDNAIFGTTMNRAFAYLNNVEEISLKNVDTSRVTDMYYLFVDCHKLKTLDVSDFDTSKVTTMYGAFAYLYDVTSIDLSGWDTSKVTDMKYMFSTDSKLKYLDLSMFNIGSAKDLQYMFSGCSGIKTLDLSNWDFSNYDFNNDAGLMIHLGSSSLSSIELLIFNNTVFAEDMHYAFGGMNSLKSISFVNVDTTKTTNMNNMFNGDENITTLSLVSYDTKNVTDMGRMFSFISKLKSIYVSDKFVVSQLINDEDMFKSAPELTGGNGTEFKDENPNDKTYAHYDGGETNPGYFQKGAGGKGISTADVDVYKVTFDPNGGSVTPTSMSVYAGQSLGYLPTPVKSQHVFAGWKVGYTDGQIVDTYYAPSSNVTLVAQWRDSNEFTITFDANLPEGETATITPPTKTVYEGDAIGDLPVATRENYYVEYWYLPDSGIRVNESYVPDGDMTVWAKWRVDINACDINCQKCLLNPEYCEDYDPDQDEREPVDPSLYCSLFKLGDTTHVMGHPVRIVNCSYPSSCNRSGFSQSACGVVYEFADVIDMKPMNSSNTTSGGWRDSELRSYVNGLNLGIPTRVASGEGFNDRASGNYITTDTTYLLSAGEVGTVSRGIGDNYIHEVTNTRALDIYSNWGHMFDEYRSKKCWDEATQTYWCGTTAVGVPWWLRNVDYTNSDHFGGIHGGSSIPDYDFYSPTSTLGVSPAFRVG